MLLLFFTCLCNGKPLLVRVEGHIPNRIRGLSNLEFINNSDLRDADWVILSDLSNEKPPGMVMRDIIEEKVPFCVMRNPNVTETDPLVTIANGTVGMLDFSYSLYQHNISVTISNESRSLYLIANEKQEGYEPTHDFPFLDNISVKFFVYEKPPAAPNMRLILFFTALIFCGLLWIYRRLNRRKAVTFWVATSDGRVVFGPKENEVSKLTYSYVLDTVTACAETRKTRKMVIKLKRFEFHHVIERMYGFVLPNGLIIVLDWEEALLETDDLGLDCEFTSKKYQVLEPPTVTFSTLRDYEPLHIEFTLDNNMKCHVDLPTSILAPFHPHGQLISAMISVFAVLNELITNNPFIHTNFQELARLCSMRINSKRAYFFEDQETLLFQYLAEGVEPLPDDVVLQIPKRCKSQPGCYFTTDLTNDGERFFVNRVCGSAYDVLIVFQVDENSLTDMFETLGLPFLSLCCVFAFQLSYTKEQTLKHDRVLSLFCGSDQMLAMEISLKTRKISYVRSLEIDFQPETVDELMDWLKSKETVGLDALIHDAETIQAVGGVISCKPLKIRLNSQSEFKRLLVSVTFYPDKNGDTFAFVIAEEDAAGGIRREHERLEFLKNAWRSLKAMNLMAFRVTDNDVLMETTQLFELLDREITENLSIRPLIPNDAVKSFEELLDGRNGVFKLARGNGEESWFHASSYEQYGFLFPVDELIQSREGSRKSLDNLTLSETSIRSVFWIVNMENDMVESVFGQPTIWDILSVDPDTKFSKFVDFIHPEDQNVFWENYQYLVMSGVENLFGEVRLLKVGGSYEWHKINFAISGDGMHCLALNIHGQKMMENELCETQKIRDLLLSSGKLALWQFKDDHTALPRMTRFDPGLNAVVVMNWTFIDTQVHPDYRDLFKKKMERAMSGEDGLEFDLPLMLDEEIWVSVRGKLQGQSRQVVGVCIDITDIRHAYNVLDKEKRKAEEANRKKTVFLANMSHEIRTPMNGIFGMLDVLALQNLTGEQRLLVDSIRASSFQLMKLLDDTLNLSKIEQGKLVASPTIFELSKLLEPICIANASRARLNHIKFKVFMSKQFPLLVYGDSQLFFQVINNLLSNAIKFTREGHVSINLQWVEEEDFEYCVVIVSDTGIGMTAEQQKVIFERFAQADASTARRFGGTGLGLSLVQEIVRFLGGSVEMESEANKGTVFTVKIPMKSIYVPYSAPFTDGKVHIIALHICDEDLRLQLPEWLEFHHYTVCFFDKPSDIADIAKKGRIDAVFVEGDQGIWSQISEQAQALPNCPPLCSCCEAGEPTIFKYCLAKPVQLTHLFRLLVSFRYGQQKTSVQTNTLASTVQGTKRILVVEDNKTNQFVMKKILETLGCQYAIAGNGQEALNVLEEQEFDMIFMDCQMPVLDGIEATKIIRRSGKIYASIPIIALTASAIEGDEKICREAGMDGYLAKPVRIQQISDIVKQFEH